MRRTDTAQPVSRPGSTEGIFTVDERVTAAGDWLAVETAMIGAAQAEVPPADSATDADEVMGAFRSELASGIGNAIRRRARLASLVGGPA